MPYTQHRRGDFSPADCLRCGQTENLIDLTGVDLTGYGRPYLCAICASELGQALGYVDPSVHEAQVTHYKGEAEEWKKRTQAAIAGESERRSLIERKTRELGDGIRNLANDFARGISAAADGGSAGLPVPAGAVPNALTGAGASLIPKQDDGGADPVGVERAGVGGESGGSQPGAVGVHVDPLAGGDSAPAGVDTAVDGSDVDESFGWIEQVDGADVGGAAISPDDAGD